MSLETGKIRSKIKGRTLEPEINMAGMASEWDNPE
jgi:hypothetical protein